MICKDSLSLCKVLIMCVLLSFAPMFSSASASPTESDTSHTAKTEAFNPGTFILDHIGDSYGWHIVTIDNHHIAIPLPIIVFSKHSGLNIFSSSRVAHGKSYNGFHLSHYGEHSGKIVEILPDKSEVLPFDISITKNVFTLLFSGILLVMIFVGIAKKYKKHKDSAPSGLQNGMEIIILFVRDDIAKASIGAKKYEKFMPYLLTAFFFIFFNNLLGLIPIFPGGANLTGNIAVTMVLALFTFVITTINANKNYWIHIINTPGVPWWLKLPIPLMPIIEFVGVLTKPFVLMVRLFANISAGHMIMLGFFSLIFIFGAKHIAAGLGISILSIAFTVFMGMLEILVAFVQAFVFTLLSALYFGMAVEDHHETKHH